jgi:hypothetical protein
MSINKATAQSQGIVLHGTLYLSNNPSTYDAETNSLVGKVMRLIELFENIDSYDEKLKIWFDENLFISEIWIGDTSRIIERGNSFNYSGHPKPEPEYLLTITPQNYSQILDLNLKNIDSFSERWGSFQQFEQQYLKHMKDHADSPLYERKLVIDLQNAENELYNYNPISDWFGTSVKMWYESFTNQTDTLNKKHYQIWDLNQHLSSLPLLSSNKRLETPYLLNLLDNAADVNRAAKGYFLHYQIPFLRKLREDRIKKVLATYGHDDQYNQYNASTSPVPNDSETDSTETTPIKKSKKKQQQLTTKQQMILLNALGFLDASIIRHLLTKHKAAILAQLLNRSVQEVRSMLTYWEGANAPKDYDCSHPDDIEKVIDLLTENNLQVSNL